MTISVDVRHRLGGFGIDAAFESEGRLTALFGPSGSGKTSLVNIVAGLIRPNEGRIVVDGRVLVDTAANVYVPVHKRRIGYVFQDARLFPHMSVRRNLDYGRRLTPPKDRYAEFGKVVDLLGIGHLLDRKPDGLSGGEKQRVAIGRALLASPRLILMDEPLASLDEARKAEIMPYIERLRDELRIPIVLVSHSVAEVARLATDMVVLENGRVAAAGPLNDVLQRLDLLPEDQRGEGGSVLEMTVAGHDESFAMTLLRSPAGEIRIPRTDAIRPGDVVRVRIRARDVMIATEPPRGLSALNVIPGTVTALNASGASLFDVSVDCGGQSILARITRQSVHVLGLTVGQPVFAVVKTVSFDTASTRRVAEG
ncbi:molybdenum ABC transporter ATP-binding protein [Aquibium oceanicum]|uniref:Molybdenum ABC transporter ATP-binding protein n=1 Tax=Aquibium oceanicum TaxID=1670800 RepID=A0A1L3SYG3_9HYPH|nr:molybdenum ABC transporter ATP-binding protein [Aquibium oceanicum]APH74355.1 molybdenum ABC transporter ATP-binding protein [Aquibium oceanicum]